MGTVEADFRLALLQSKPVNKDREMAEALDKGL